MINLPYLISWIKKNTVTVLLVILAFLVLLLTIVGFWLRIRGFKVSDLLLKLQMAETKNEINHLNVRKAVLKERTNAKKEDIEEVDKEINELKKKAIIKKAEIKGLSNEDVSKRFTELGF